MNAITTHLTFDAFWARGFGMLTDKLGGQWMFNYEDTKKG
jgi:uncharacterized glyoxalase superfamily protein PhnB